MYWTKKNRKICLNYLSNQRFKARNQTNDYTLIFNEVIFKSLLNITRSMYASLVEFEITVQLGL